MFKYLQVIKPYLIFILLITSYLRNLQRLWVISNRDSKKNKILSYVIANEESVSEN